MGTHKHFLVKRLGKEYRDVRLSKDLKIAEVIRRVDKYLEDISEILEIEKIWIAKELEDFAIQCKSELWLARFERGEVALPSRIVIDLLIQVLGCNAQEQTQILGAGGYHGLAYFIKTNDGSIHQNGEQDKATIIFKDQPDKVASWFNEAMVLSHGTACTLLRKLNEKDQGAFEDSRAKLKFVRAAITIALKELE